MPRGKWAYAKDLLRHTDRRLVSPRELSNLIGLEDGGNEWYNEEQIEDRATLAVDGSVAPNLGLCQFNISKEIVTSGPKL